MKLHGFHFNVFDQRFPNPDQERDYVLSQEWKFILPICAGSFWMMTIGAGLAYEHDIFSHECRVTVKVLDMILIAGAIILAVLAITKTTGRLKRIRTENLWLVAASSLIVLAFWGNSYYRDFLEGHRSLSAEPLPCTDSSAAHEQMVALFLSALTAFNCLICPVRTHIAWVIPLSGMLLFILMAAIVPPPCGSMLFYTLMCKILILYVSLHGSFWHEQQARDKWRAQREVKRLTLLSRGIDSDAYAAEEMKTRFGLEKEILQQLPDRPRVCILGSTAFKAGSSEQLTKALAQEFTTRLSHQVVVITGGMPGAQQTFAQNLGADFGAVVHLLPEGNKSNFSVGVDLTAGKDLPERMHIFGNLGHVYLTIEGGPGVAKEAKQASERGALVLPMISTGGASSGMFGFPVSALERPKWSSEELWSALTATDDPDAAAAAVVDMILTFIQRAAEGPDGAMHPPELEETAGQTSSIIAVTL